MVRKRTAIFSLLAPVIFLATALPLGAAELPVALVNVTSPAAPFSDARLDVKTVAEADCQISVLYKSGPSRAKGLVPRQADSVGRVAWVWRVGSNTTPGQWPIIVMCRKGQDEGQLRTSFEVR
jgi:hypothetical protein